MSSLGALRAAIEDVDARLIAVIAERLALARAVGQLKAADGEPVLDPAREAAVVTRVSALSREAGLPADEMRALYWRLLAMSRRAQSAATSTGSA
jgi:chorismate mutase